ncbi:helix-turn-helix domain-containing protein [Pseudonocardia xishanensis]|uniref:TetR/AcrR family transcriptional regulator n=1 Tax=Pseudonocardia xishanensis TaxID=630995 RepID=A0ABP8S5Z1_9PSEU
MTAPEPTRERILAAAEELFAEKGFDATPTSRIAARAEVPKGLVHYYFARKADLLEALVERLPRERIDRAAVVVPGDVEASLCRLVAVLDALLDSSAVLSHLLWREADTHPAVRDALHQRFDALVAEIRAVLAESGATGDVDSAAMLLASAVSYRHSVFRHAAVESAARTDMTPELRFLAAGLTSSAPARPGPA